MQEYEFSFKSKEIVIAILYIAFCEKNHLDVLIFTSILHGCSPLREMRFIVHNPTMESFVRNAEEALKTKYTLSSRGIAHMWSTDEPISRKRVAPEIMDMLNSTVYLLVHQTG